jgi:hypothetical protein
MMLDQAPNGCQEKSFQAAGQSPAPLTHPQLAMMHFVYEIRVTLSTKISCFPAASAAADRFPFTLTPSRRNFLLWRQADLPGPHDQFV